MQEKKVLYDFKPYDFYLHVKDFFLSDIQRKSFRYFLEDFLNISTHDFLMDRELKISSYQFKKIQFAKKKIAQDYPLAYLTKKKEFCGICFYIKEGVLIPREETEELVDWCLKESKGKKEVLDIGFGSGNITLSLKNRNPDWKVMGIDISPLALKVARKNAKMLGFSKNIFHLKSIEDFLPKKKFQILISNPPYIKESDEYVSFSVRSFEPESALFAKEEGLYFYKQISKKLPKLLEKGGNIFLEIGFQQAELVKNIFQDYFDLVQVKKDSYGKDRMIGGFGYKASVKI